MLINIEVKSSKDKEGRGTDFRRDGIDYKCKNIENVETLTCEIISCTQLFTVDCTIINCDGYITCSW